jgi:prepilin-type N-terminal cleavage/methylation domain-containing protein
MKNRKRQKGFTLVELVVVIAILGILAAIAVPRLLGFQARAKAQADRQSAVQVRNAVALLYSNAEIGISSGSTLTISSSSGAANGGNIALSSVVPKWDAVTGGVLNDADVQKMINDLTGDIQLKGTQPIEIEVQADNEIKVVQPAGIE